MDLINGLGGTAGFGENYIARNDDGYASNISITSVFGSQGLKFFGNSYTTISINNNGNITFGGSGLSSYTPWGMQTVNNRPMIAAFFADVDTRGYVNSVNGPDAVTATPGGTSRGSNLVWYDFDPSGYGTLTITWDDVGYYGSHYDKLNAFQMRLIGTGGGNFDIEFRYETMSWTTGDASGGTGGLGGTVARAGFTAGDGINYFELSQSGIQDQMLNLEATPGNTGVDGYYFFSSSSGAATNDTLFGDEENNVLSGGGGTDTLYGMGGDDQLDGGIGTADRMYGGEGDDRFIVRAVDDIIVEYAGEGNDTVQTSLTFSIAALANIENIMLTGSSAVKATGNGQDNVLIGNSAANTLNGGVGSDTASYELAGSAVTVNLGLATAQATGGGGADTLVSIENLTGSVFNDRLTGNSGSNVISGLNGADIMVGLAGDDVYLVDNTADIVTEALNAGFDSVRSTATYTLRVNVENLVLKGLSAINGTGNAGNNYLSGNSGNNSLSGLGGNDALAGGGGDDILNGGTGSDVMRGGNGSDIYFVDAVGDRLTELANQGTDRVNSYIAWTLGLNFENLTLMGLAAVNGTGNTLANTLIGNGAANTLSGLGGNDILNGGLGNDTLTGGTGADSFLFSTALNAATNKDTITDFVALDDTILLENAVFTGLATAGTLADANFLASAAGTAADSDDYILYNTTTGALYYDADGNGAGAAVQFAQLGISSHPAITSADFVVY